MGVGVCPHCRGGMRVRAVPVPYLVRCPTCEETLLCAGLSSRSEVVLLKLGGAFAKAA